MTDSLETRVARLEKMALTTLGILETMKQMIDTLAGFRDKVHPL